MSGNPKDHGRNVKSTTSETREDKLKKVKRKKREWQNFMPISGTASVSDDDSVQLAKEIIPRDGKISEMICHVSDNTEGFLVVSVKKGASKTDHRYEIKTGTNFIEEFIDVTKGAIVEVRLEFAQAVNVMDCGFSSILKIKQ